MGDLLSNLEWWQKRSEFFEKGLRDECKKVDELQSTIDSQAELIRRLVEDGKRLAESLVIENKLPHEYFDKRVMALGEEIGYGYVMQQCSSMWRERLEQSDMAGGEFNVGDCVLTIARSLSLHTDLMNDIEKREG